MEDTLKNIKKLDLKQNAIKILINSIYGAFGNKWFYFYDPDIAQSITLQGQDLIKFSIKAVNHYFKERWHKDAELHKILGIDKYTIHQIKEDAAIYTDTDSIYVQFDSAINSIEGASFTRDEAMKICIEIDSSRLASYFDTCFIKYGQQFNTKNRLKFKLENLSEYGLWLKKKNYALKVAYEPNAEKEILPKEKRYLIIKGLESIKGSYPIWARKRLDILTDFILEKGKVLDIEKDLIPKLERLRDDFSKLSIDEVAFNFKIRVYNKYIIDDEASLEFKKGMSIFAKAAAYHNHMLITSGLDKKYSKIREGEKIKFYYCSANEKNFDVFAYAPENYPEEIVLPIDMELQFFSLIVEPINRLLEAMKMNPLNAKLKRNVNLVTPKTKKVLTDDQIYPLYVVDSNTLDKIEVPEKFWKIIGNANADVSEEDFEEYLSIITRYGLNTIIIPKFELEKYIKRVSKKKGIVEDEKQLSLSLEESED